MRILIAEDDRVSRRLLEADLRRWGHEVVEVADGTAAWKVMTGEDAPDVSILDWMMPGLDGVEICRLARARAGPHPVYIIILTARTARQDIVTALEAGADDYLTKPFDPSELKARVGAAARIVRLERELSARIAELEGALARVDELHGILPICSYCRRVRNDADAWHRIEDYVSAHSAVRFSHGICPECMKAVVGPELEAWRKGG